MNSIGLRREEKHFESRTPLNPTQVKELIQAGINVFVESSALRTYKDSEYEENHGIIVDDIFEKTDFIFAIKEIPIDLIYPNKVYSFFSHTIKGQAHNMPLLKKIIESKSTLIDYEKITNKENRRLIYFGNYAGYAGMIDTFWALGEKLNSDGIISPFLNVKQTHKYKSLNQAIKKLKNIGKSIMNGGTGILDRPIIIGILGYGNVSKGAQEIINCFPNEKISPENLNEFIESENFSSNKVYFVVFYEHHLVTPVNDSFQFDLQDYYENPSKYKSQFFKYLPHFSVIVNAIFWDKQYPRFVTKELIENLFSQSSQPFLQVIGDISCDIEGAIEVTLDSTTIDDPVYVYDVNKKKQIMGFIGKGPVILAIDNLPCELPKESSTFFGNQLKGLIPNIVSSNYDTSFEDNSLPDEIKNAVIVYKGELTPNYKYLTKYINN